MEHAFVRMTGASILRIEWAIQAAPLVNFRLPVVLYRLAFVSSGWREFVASRPALWCLNELLSSQSRSVTTVAFIDLTADVSQHLGLCNFIRKFLGTPENDPWSVVLHRLMATALPHGLVEPPASDRRLLMKPPLQATGNWFVFTPHLAVTSVEQYLAAYDRMLWQVPAGAVGLAGPARTPLVSSLFGVVP